MRRLSKVASVFLMLASLLANAHGAPNTNATPAAISDLDLEDLGAIKIVSVSKREETLRDTPAAAHILTSDDIARSGATTIPEALRLVPGLNVAQINGSTWAIGARGFQSQFANKLLVMMDGISVYTPVYSGVLWDDQNYFLPDLERIEVVLGPGGSIWGANAMNGVINILSKSARDTQGGLLYGGGGSTKYALVGARYGWQTGSNTFVRVYGQYDNYGPMQALDGHHAEDAISSGQAGFRLDGYPNEGSQWTIKSDTHWSANEKYTVLPDTNAAPYFVRPDHSITRQFSEQLSGRWQREFSADSTLQLLAYYDYSSRKSATVNYDMHSADLELHHTWSGWRRQVIDWGLDGRVVYVDSDPAWVKFQPDHTTSWLGSGFIQDEISLVPDCLTFTVGGKLEGHSDTGVLPQPNARLAWRPAERHTLWGAWSQARRSPSWVERNAEFAIAYYPPSGTELRYKGANDVGAEKLQAWELGWRWDVSRHITFDVSGYYYQYSDLIMQTYDYDNATATVLPLKTVNDTRGWAYGSEISLTWKPNDIWFASLNYAYRHTELRSTIADPFDYAGDAVTSPRQTVALISGLKLGSQVELNGALRYLDNIPFYHVPSYFELDAQLIWRPSPHWELALVGQNLLHAEHSEYRASLVDQSTEIRRGVYAKATWKF